MRLNLKFYLWKRKRKNNLQNESQGKALAFLFCPKADYVHKLIKKTKCRPLGDIAQLNKGKF